MRAADLGYAPRFQAFSVASNWFRQNGVISSHPKRLTRAVRQNPLLRRRGYEFELPLHRTIKNRKRRLPSCQTRSAAEPRMNLTLLYSNWKMRYGKRNLHTFHRSSARPARRVIRRAVRPPKGKHEYTFKKITTFRYAIYERNAL